MDKMVNGEYSLFFVLEFREELDENNISKSVPYGLGFNVSDQRDRYITFIKNTLDFFRIPYISISFNSSEIEDKEIQTPAEIVAHIEEYYVNSHLLKPKKLTKK